MSEQRDPHRRGRRSDEDWERVARQAGVDQTAASVRPDTTEPPAGLVEGLRLLLGWGRERRLRLEAERDQAERAANARGEPSG